MKNANLFDIWSKTAKDLHESIKDLNVICGSGHRPPRLGLEYSRKHNEILTKFAVKSLEILDTKVDYVISGAALGWDSALAHAAFLLKIPYIMAIPFRNFESKWSQSDKNRFIQLNSHSTYSIYICDGDYENSKYFSRDAWMVHCSKKLIGLLDNKPDKSGTGITFEYAKTHDLEIINLWDQWEEYRKLNLV